MQNFFQNKEKLQYSITSENGPALHDTCIVLLNHFTQYKERLPHKDCYLFLVIRIYIISIKWFTRKNDLKIIFTTLFYITEVKMDST